MKLRYEGDEQNLKGKVVLITGSSSGIGKETAIAFAKRGSLVAATYSKGKENGEKVVQECQRYSDAALYNLDVRDDASIRKVVNDSVTRFHKIDILVNNAGVMREDLIHNQSIEDINEQVNVNLLGVIKVTRAVLPFLYQQNKGMILNIASGAGKEGFEELTVYCATKFGVRGFTQSLSKELPDTIRTYCINPSMTATRMTGYTGMDPKKVADVIVNAAEEKFRKKSGDDVDVWNYVQ
jgi:NADP-dependent 3-hydroxy acid dehydrogenase YdfG